MHDINNILSIIKKQVQETVPGAQVFLFGSRANNSATEESDWDILILTQQRTDKQLKDAIHKNIFPLSVEIGAFINLLVVQQQEWEHNPSYYSLHQTIDASSVPV